MLYGLKAFSCNLIVVGALLFWFLALISALRSAWVDITESYSDAKSGPVTDSVNVPGQDQDENSVTVVPGLPPLQSVKGCDRPKRDSY